MSVEGGWDCHVHVFDDRPVASGHYVPKNCGLRKLERVSNAELGITRLVLVQPSVYGTDNSLLLDALVEGQGRHRGVVVIDDQVGDDHLERMHALGVRGVRFNLVSPVGNRWGSLPPWLPKLTSLRWHVQWHAQPRHLPEILRVFEQTRVVPVLDHLAGLTAASALDDKVWSDLQSLASVGAWIKVSAPYRLEAAFPYAELDSIIARVVEMFGKRCVWGSDWPHTFFLQSDELVPHYGSLFQTLNRAIGSTSAQTILYDNPLRLYF